MRNPTPRPVRRLSAVTIGALAVVGLAACGDDADAAIAPEHEQYCEAATAIDENGGPPTAEMAQAARSAAPDEIRPTWDEMFTSFEAHGGDMEALFEDLEFLQNLDEIELWEADHCGPEHADPALVSPGAGDE